MELATYVKERPHRKLMKKKRFATGTFKNYARSEGRWVGTPISTCMCREGVFLNFKTSTRYSISNFLQKNCCGQVK